MGLTITQISGMVEGVAPELWEIIVRQVYVDAISSFITSMLLAVFFGLVLKYSLKKINEDKGEYKKSGWDSDSGYSWMGVASIALTILWSAIAILAIVDVVRVFINPKYYAIKNIMELL